MEKLKALGSWVLDRLGENSTWRGIITIATGAGAVIDQDQAVKIIAGGLTIVGVINVMRKAPPSHEVVADLQKQIAEVPAAISTGNTQFLKNAIEGPVVTPPLSPLEPVK